MSVAIVGNGGTVADVDEARNVQIYQTIPGYPSAGGWYSVTGRTEAVVAASLAANTTLMSARFSNSSTRKAYIVRMRVLFTVATAGAAGGIGQTVGLQRFTTATPTAGTARTPDRLGPTKGSATDMTDVRDSNAALTVTSVVFGNVTASSLVASSSTNVAPLDWVIEFPAPLELSAGDGVCLRTQNAGPGTATWLYTYNMYWFER